MHIHVVKSGETLWQIANYYGVSVASITQINGLQDPNRIVVGLALVIPTEDVYYTVQPGDTLWAIARRYGTTVEFILQNNQIADPGNIYPGMVIYIPALRYRVQPGETLGKLLKDMEFLCKI